MTAPIELRTERLLLRPFSLRDVEDVLAYAGDPDWNRYLGLPQPYTLDHAEEFVARSVVLDWERTPRWAIVYDDRVVGGIDLRIEPDARIGELGYSIASRLWGRGLTAEAAGAVIGYAFDTLGLERVQAFADVRNRQSWRVMEKLGMQREGLLRSHRDVHGERVDDVVYAILRDEWERL